MGDFSYKAWLVLEVNCRLLVNEHDDLSIFSLFVSLANAFFLFSEYKQSSVVEKWVINGNANFATTSEDKFVASRSLHVWNKLPCLCPETYSKMFLEVDAVILFLNLTFFSSQFFPFLRNVK